MRAALLLLAVGSTACVERRLHVRTDPAGAVVRVNGNEIGRSPCSWRFDHYGTVLVEVDMEGYEPQQRIQKLRIPWYQRPGADFFADVAYPGTIRDDHEVAITLVPRRRVGAGDKAALDRKCAELAERAKALRGESERP